MSFVEVRSWSEVCHAAYVFDGDPLGRFVGTAATRPAALRLGRKVLREFGESPLAPTVSGRVSDLSEHACVGELDHLNSDGPRSVTTPAHLPLTAPGASP